VESGAMAAIYSNAYLVVDASCAQDSFQGFISPTMRTKRYVLAANVENEDGSKSEIYTRDKSPHGNRCNPLWSTSDNKKSPLASRVWTLQEQILSTGMIHFESNEMFW
jgi:hypothetical protein